MFQNYYAQDYSSSNSLSGMDKREFGFSLFEGLMLRHRSFKNNQELKHFLQSYVPSNAYYSCAYYENPEAEMEKKGWLGADLIFDIDADHIPTPCDKIHDEWRCANCDFTGKGITPQQCPVCNSEKLDADTWPCEVCLDSAKTETLKLLDMLLRDFGFSEKELHVFFSGHRGFHVHVENKAVESLDAFARKEIVDYISGLGFEIGLLLGNKKNRKGTRALSGVSFNVVWHRRIARGIHDFIHDVERQNLAAVGLRKNVGEAISKNKDALLKNLNETGTIRPVKSIGVETWKKIITFCAKTQSARIDTVVTTDVHRLIRLPETLHGKTGLKKIKVPTANLETFDPFKEAIAFKKGTATVFVSSAPSFRIGDHVFGPYRNQKVELPMAAAMLLVCKGRAKVIEYV